MERPRSPGVARARQRRMVGRLRPRPKDKIGNGPKRRNDSRPSLRPTQFTRTPSTPSTAKAAKAAKDTREARPKAKARAKSARGKGPRRRTDRQRRRQHTHRQAPQTRQCFNCGEYGHLGKDCNQPDKRKTGKPAARSLEESSSQAGSQGSVRSLASAQGGMRRLCAMRTLKSVDPEGWKASSHPRMRKVNRESSVSMNASRLYISSPLYNSDTDISYSNSSNPAGLISRSPKPPVSIFQPLAEDDADSDESCVAESCVVESRAKITLTKRQRTRNRATAVARARKAIQIPLRKKNIMQLRNLVHIELMNNTSELRKLRKLPIQQTQQTQDEAATAADA